MTADFCTHITTERGKKKKKVDAGVHARVHHVSDVNELTAFTKPCLWVVQPVSVRAGILRDIVSGSELKNGVGCRSKLFLLVSCDGKLTLLLLFAEISDASTGSDRLGSIIGRQHLARADSKTLRPSFFFFFIYRSAPTKPAYHAPKMCSVIVNAACSRPREDCAAI